ncbi:MAG: hypothetical protein ACLQK4_09800 [Acidimicrobiales bacterium]
MNEESKDEEVKDMSMWTLGYVAKIRMAEAEKHASEAHAASCSRKRSASSKIVSKVTTPRECGDS